MKSGQNSPSSRPLRRKKKPALPQDQPFGQLISDLEGLEKLQSLQLRLIREIRRQVAELQQRTTS